MVAQQKRLTDYSLEGGLVEGVGRNPASETGVLQASPVRPVQAGGAKASLLEQVVHPDNLASAWENVRRNAGAPGVDGVTVEEFPEWWKLHGETIRAKLLAERYRPAPVRRVGIPKPGGGERRLGIPTVLDRVVQHAVLRVMQPLVDPAFSEHSYGFRPGRSAHDAVRAVQGFVAEGCTWVVDIDLERFFDRVNHDLLMHRVSLRVGDPGLLRLIRQYLRAGVMTEGVWMESGEGVPQGGPLSPLLANVLLDGLDRELERRGHRFARYADDCNVYVESEAAGRRVFASVCVFVEKRLRLRVNREKSAVDRPWNRKFLGFSFVVTKEGVKLRVAPQAVQRFRERVRGVSRRTRGDSLDAVIRDLNGFLRGWFEYFRIAEWEEQFKSLDGWVRRRLRCLKWVQWKRGWTRVRELVRLGVPKHSAVQAGHSSRGAWYCARFPSMHRAMKIEFFDEAGLFRLDREWRRSQDTA